MPDKMIVPPGFETIEIDGRTLVGKLDFVCKYQMGVLGIRLSDWKVFFEKDQSLAGMTLIANTFACIVAGNYVNKDNPGAPVSIPTPQYWMSTIDEEKWGEVCSFVQKVLLKAAPPATAPVLVEKPGATQPN